MNEPGLEEKVRQLSAKIDSLFLGTKLFLLVLFLLACVVNILVTSSINKYEQLFADALPGKPLPTLTLLVVSTKILLTILAFMWPIVGFVAALIQRSIKTSLLLFSSALLCVLIQFALVYLAMQLPMTGLISGMSDHP